MTEDQNNTPATEEVKEKVIGEFTPKRKFLNFVSAVNGLRIRFISDIAFIKGEKLTGLGLDGVIFKVTICDEGTIKFEEVDTNVTDTAYRKRLIEDICDRDVTGYAKKYVVSGLEFADKDGKNCYLEVEEAKPIDKLKSLFDDMDNKTEISDKGRSFLDELLGESSETEVETTEVVTELGEIKVEVAVEKPAETMMEEAFRKMNEDKINELRERVEEKEKDIRKTKVEISQAETKIKTASDQLRVLNTRLETLSPGDEPNGYVFLVSDEQKNETGLDETTKGIADKIADLMNLKKEVLFDYLTGGFYKIKIGKKGENDKKLESIDKEVLEKILSVDPMGKMSMSDTNEVEYRGDLNWHQLTAKMIRKGFEQDPEFDKVSGSNSYEAKTEDDGKNYTGTKDESKEKCSHDNCGCGDKPEETDHMSGYKSEIERMAKGLGMKGVDFRKDGITLIPEDKKDDKTKLLKSIDTPQDLIIVGMTVGDSEEFSITDDYSGFDINIGDKKKFGIESDGFVSIVTVQEFLDFKKNDEDAYEAIIDGACGAVLLQNFSGEIRVGVKDKNGNPAMRPLKTTYDFDLNDYILHQFDEYVNVIVDLPAGTNAVEITDKNLVSLLRDGKINTILNEKI